MMWVREEDVHEGSLDDSHVEEMQIWGRLHKKCGGLPFLFRSASHSLRHNHCRTAFASKPAGGSIIYLGHDVPGMKVQAQPSYCRCKPAVRSLECKHGSVG